ncbi:unnamed protein product, partial [Polarella glacialis]
LNTVVFVLAAPGMYEALLARKEGGNNYGNITITTLIRICGQETKLVKTLRDVRDNMTITDEIKVPSTGCARPDPAKFAAAQKTWQSTVWHEDPAFKTIQELSDNNGETCVETGGGARFPPDKSPWWRTDLGKTLYVEGIWLTGQGFRTDAADHADVWISDSTATKASEGILCAKGVRIGGAGDPRLAPLPVACTGGRISGAHVWVVPVPPEKPLSLCEVQIFSMPLPAVSQLSLTYGRYNLTESVCGVEK